MDGMGGGFDFNFLKRIKSKFTLYNDYCGIIHQGHPFGIKLFAQAKKVAILNKPLYKYRITPISTTRGSLSMEKIPPYMSYLKPYFDDANELKSYFKTMSVFIFHKEIFDFIQNIPNSELKSLMKECFYPYYTQESFLHFIRIQKDPLNLYKQALIYTGDNPQAYVIKTFEEASDEEKFRWFQKTLTMDLNPLKAQINALNSKNTQLEQELKFGTATQRIHNHLSYKLGQIIIRNSKSLFGFIKLPFLLMAMTLAHKEQEKIYKEKIKANPNLALPPLESYKDYQEALKEKECLTYKLGLAFMKGYKSWYKGGLVKFYFEAKRLEREFKGNKGLNKN